LKRARDLAELLNGRAEFAEAETLQKAASDTIVRIREEQEKNKITTGSKVSQHINTYDANMFSLERVREAVGSLENLVLGAGQDPGELIGSVKDIPEPNRDIDLDPGEYRIALFKVKVTNPSEDTARTMPEMIRELPSEITLEDVLDTGGLELTSDPKTGTTYVSTNGLELAAGGARTFVVKIRDKWNVNGPRIERLTQMGSNILVRLGDKEQLPSVRSAIAAIDEELERIAAEPLPQTLDSRYVAFFRDQADRIDLLESKLNRIISVLKPVNKNQMEDPPKA